MNLKEAMDFTRKLTRNEFARFLAEDTEIFYNLEFTLHNEMPEIDIDVELTDDRCDALDTGISVDTACKKYGISVHTDFQLIENSYCSPPDEGDDEYGEYQEWQNILKLFPLPEPAYFTETEIRAYQEQEEREHQANRKLYALATGKEPTSGEEVDMWALDRRLARLDDKFQQGLEELRQDWEKRQHD